MSSPIALAKGIEKAIDVGIQFALRGSLAGVLEREVFEPIVKIIDRERIQLLDVVQARGMHGRRDRHRGVRDQRLAIEERRHRRAHRRCDRCPWFALANPRRRLRGRGWVGRRAGAPGAAPGGGGGGEIKKNKKKNRKAKKMLFFGGGRAGTPS